MTRVFHIFIIGSDDTSETNPRAITERKMIMDAAEVGNGVFAVDSTFFRLGGSHFTGAELCDIIDKLSKHNRFKLKCLRLKYGSMQLHDIRRLATILDGGLRQLWLFPDSKARSAFELDDVLDRIDWSIFTGLRKLEITVNVPDGRASRVTPKRINHTVNNIGFDKLHSRLNLSHFQLSLRESRLPPDGGDPLGFIASFQSMSILASKMLAIGGKQCICTLSTASDSPIDGKYPTGIGGWLTGMLQVEIALLLGDEPSTLSGQSPKVESRRDFSVRL